MNDFTAVSPKSKHAFISALVHFVESVKHWNDHTRWICYALLTGFLLFTGMSEPRAQVSGGVNFLTMAGPPTTAVISSGSTYTATINGTVKANGPTIGDEVISVEIYDNDIGIKNATWPVDLNTKTEAVTNYTRTFSLSIPLALGSHSLKIVAETYNGSGGETQVFPITVTSVSSTTPGTGINDAAFVSQTSLVSPLELGRSYPVVVTMKNTGTSTWMPGAAKPYRLGTQSPQDNVNFTTARVDVITAVVPGDTAQFVINATPTATGNFTFQWQMLTEGGEWFGSKTTAMPLSVTKSSIWAQFTAPTTDQTVTTSGSAANVSFTGNATPTSSYGIASIVLSEAGVQFASGSPTGPFGVASITATRSLSLGVHAITLTATDTSGATTAVVRKVTVTGMPPTVNFTTPAANATVSAIGTSATVSFAGSAIPATGATISSLVLRENGVTFANGVGTTTASVSASKSLSLGSHSIEMLATDSKGLSTSVTRVVSVGTTGPTATFTSPVDGATYSSGSKSTFSIPVNAVGTAGSGATITGMYLYSTTNGTTTNIYNSTSGTLSVNLPLPVGQYVLGIEAMDSLKVVSPRKTLTVNVVAVSPIVTLSSPLNGTVTVATGSTVAITVAGTVNINGGTPLTKLEILDNGSVIATPTATATYSGVFNLAPGAHSLQMRATNYLGAQGVSTPSNMTIVAAKQGSDARFVSQVVSNSLHTGEPSSVTIQMLNTGTTTWVPGGVNAFRLGTQSPQDNRNWNLTGRGSLTGAVATGQVGTFVIPITAPQASGTYNMQWQMLQENVAWFGEMSSIKAISVGTAPSPTVSLSGISTNVRVSGTQTATVSFTGSAAATTGRSMVKLELFEANETGEYSSAAPVATLSSSLSNQNWNPTISLQAGIYYFKLRATDSAGAQTESKSVPVTITNSSLAGAVSGIRTNNSLAIQLFGWTCQPGNASALNYKVFLDAPSFAGGATLLTSGVANVSTDVDSSASQQCNTPDVGHHFVVNLGDYTAQYPGRTMFVVAETPDHLSSIVLPCADNSCTIPDTLRVSLTAPNPNNKDEIVYPAPIFIRMITNAIGSLDEVGFYVNGKWVAAQRDDSVAAYVASVSGLPVSSTPYSVYAKVRQGNTTVLSMQNQFKVVTSQTIGLTSPSAGASLTLGTAQMLSATVTGATQSVKFFANGALIGTGTLSGTVWTATWTPTTAGTVILTAVAYDGAGAQLGQSTAVSVTVVAGSGSAATELPVGITPPHLGNADTGTLPGQLNVGSDGASSYDIELAVPPGTAGMQPKLSLNYSSNGSNGLVGLGWSLGGLSTVHRCAKTIAEDNVVGRISFDTSDRLCLDGMRLFRADGTNPGSDAGLDAAYWVAGAQYRTEIEGFARVTRLTNGFKVELKDGRVQYYGQNADASDVSSAVAAQGRTGQTLLWALARTEDRSGNYMTVQYTTDPSTGEYLPTQIRYGGNTNANQTPDLAVRFSYETRPDAQIQYMGGSRNDLRHRLTNIQTFISTAADGSAGSRVRSYIVHYINSTNSGRSLVDSVQVCAATDSECLPKTTISWGSNPLKLVQKRSWKEIVHADNETTALKVVTGDFVGDGTTAYLYPIQGAASCPTCTGDAGQVRPFTGQLNGEAYFAQVSLPSGNKFTEVMAGDMNGDGRDDLVFVDISTRNWAYCLALPPSGSTLNFAACQLGPTPLPARRNYEPNNGDLPHLVSLRNDGRAQLVAFDSANNMLACAYADNAVGCLTSASVMPSGNPVFDAVPIDLSKQGMTDFYSVWTRRDRSSSGVTTCNFYGNTLTCKNITTAAGLYGQSPADMNGDGLTDFAYYSLAYNANTGVTTFTTHVCLSKETDVDCNSIVFDSTATASSYLIPAVGDLTGDSLSYYAGSSPTNASALALCHLFDGRNICAPIDVSGVQDVAAVYGYPRGDTTDTFYIDGSGIPAFRACTIPYSVSNQGYQGCISYTAALPANQDKLTAVVNGIGQREEVDYARGDDASVYTRYASVNGVEQRPRYPQLASNAGVMAKALRRSNGEGGWLSSSYTYAGAMRDANGRGSLGFTKTTVTDPNGITTESVFAQAFPFVGMANHVTRIKSGCVLEDTVNTLESQPFNLAGGGQNFFVDVGQIAVTRHDLDCSDLGSVLTVNQYTDSWGNLNTQTVTSTGNGETFVTKTASVFNTGSGVNYLSGLPTSVAVTKTNSSNVSLTRTVVYSYNATTGLRDSETIEPSNAAYKLLTTYDRSLNAFGLVNKQVQSWTDPACADAGWPSSLNGACSSAKSRTVSDTTYDKGRFPVTVRNALGQAETRTYDAGSGMLLTRVDANNLLSSWSLDGFGRVTTERGPDGNETRTYVKACAGDCPSYATVAQVTDHFNGSARIAVPQVTYLDSAGHAMRTVTWGFDGTKIVADQRYDALGRLWETDWPRFDGAAAYLANRQEYDDLNRRNRLTSVDEAGVSRTATTQYQGFKTILTNLKLQVKTEWRDVIAQLRQVDDSNSPVGTTKFAYDPFGNLGQTTDPSQNVITVTHDLLGRRSDLTDPDLGWIHYDVDPVGQAWAQTSPNQRAVSKKTYMAYDLLGRMTARYEPDLESHWLYDTATKGVGKLAQAYTMAGSTTDYSRTQTYDPFGQPSLTTTKLSDATYTSRIDYDAWGRVITNTNQRGSDAPKVFGTRYNAYGYMARIERASLVLLQVTAQDAARRPTALAFGNGLSQTRAYYPQTGRLQNGTLATGASALRLKEGYTYDQLGNMLERTQYWDAGGFIEDFTYDALNRLQTSQVQGGALQTFTYDATGSITSKTGTGTYTYPTPGAGAVRPHAVSTVSSLSGTFGYDNDGNLLSGAGRTASWTLFDMPSQITKGSASATFVYGPEHQRVRQTRSDGTVVVYAGVQEVETKAGVVTVKTYWPNGIGVEIDRGSSATEMSWMHADRLGSMIALSNESGALREKLEYDVWGKRRSKDDNVSTPDSLDGVTDNRGFTGHEMLDQLDLVHMNGRVYEPALGKFFSADPFVADPNNGQNYNRYSYVSNNPTNLTDPTGFIEERPATTLAGGGDWETAYSASGNTNTGSSAPGNSTQPGTAASQASASNRVAFTSANTIAEKAPSGPTPQGVSGQQEFTSDQVVIIRGGIKRQQEFAGNMLNSLSRWNENDQSEFERAFGTRSAQARRTIQALAQKEKNSGLKVKNFRIATSSDFGGRDPSGVFAFVHPEDASHTIYVGGLFWGGSLDEIGGTIFHEFSHFNNIGPTQDRFGQWYGGMLINSPFLMRELREKRPDLSIWHSYSIENYAKGVK
jgi:RHS repeat-associated protein